jgi:predicted RNA-binding protein
MCLSTVYVDSTGKILEVMQDVARIEAENDGYNLFDLFGARKFVQGTIKFVDLIDEHKVVLEEVAEKGIHAGLALRP